jgi:hypothetical protein
MYNSSQQADAQGDAADQMADASAQSGRMSYNQWLQSQAMQMPWYQAGNRGLNALQVALGLATPEQIAAVAPVQNESTFDSEAFLKAHPSTNGGDSLSSVIGQWGISPYEYWRDYGQNQGMDFTYKAGYGPETTPYGDAAGAAGASSGLPGYGDLNRRFTIDDFKANVDPSYEWRKQQGIDALAASGAAAGNYGSGNMGVALQDYGQNLASTEYQNAYNRWNQEQANAFNRLATMAGIGQVTATNLGTQGEQAATSIGNSLVNAANALGAGRTGSANAWASGFGNLANYGIGALDRWERNQKQNRTLSGDSVPSSDADYGSYGNTTGANSWGGDGWGWGQDIGGYTDYGGYGNASGANSWGGAGWGWGQ